MAHDDLSGLHSTLWHARSRPSFRAHRQLSIHIALVVSLAASLFLVVSSVLGTETRADAWLDRVERNLRRIESASKYTEPVGVGSKAASGQHNQCIHKGVEAACEKLIWRSPELLPIRDWAIGTAHIKRGEMRERRGDVDGAIEDYVDAMGYHQFPNLNARIKRLKLRQKQIAERDAEKKAAEEKERAAKAEAEKVTAQPQNLADVEPRHPIVVVAGWAATVADKDGTPTVQNADVQPTEARVSTATEAVPQTEIQTGPESETAAVVTARQMRIAARFAPGHQVSAVQSEASASTSGMEPQIRKIKTHKIQFPVDEQVESSLARVRSKTDKVLTTAALPDRKATQRRAHQQSNFAMLAALALFTLMVSSTLAVAMGWRPALPSGLLATERKPVLSVEELETLIKNRTAEATATRLPPRSQPSSDVAGTATDPVLGASSREIKNAAPNAPEISDPQGAQANDIEFEDHGAPELPLPEITMQRTTAEQATELSASKLGDADTREDQVVRAPIAVTEMSEHPDGVLRALDPTLLRRVSYGAASLIVAGGRAASIDNIVSKVDATRRADLMDRLVRWDRAGTHADGVLNPFAVPIGSDDALVARQRFNAAFEFHSCIFESIFGLRFVYDQKVMLRHILILLHAMPNGSLKTLYECLESPRSLEPLRQALSDIEHVATRIFFTTVFSSEEFSAQANYMRKRLAPILDNELVVRLCCAQPTVDPLKKLGADGRWIFLPSESDGVTSQQSAVLVRSLFSVLAMRNFEQDAKSEPSEVATSIFLPNLKRQMGAKGSDVAFLQGQVERAGYIIL